MHSTGALLWLALLHVLLELYHSRSPPSTPTLPLALHSRPSVRLRWLVHQPLHMTHSTFLKSEVLSHHSVLLCRHVHQPLHIVPPPPPCRLDQPHQLQLRSCLQGEGGWSGKVRY